MVERRTENSLASTRLYVVTRCPLNDPLLLLLGYHMRVLTAHKSSSGSSSRTGTPAVCVDPISVCMKQQTAAANRYAFGIATGMRSRAPGKRVVDGWRRSENGKFFARQTKSENRWCAHTTYRETEKKTLQIENDNPIYTLFSWLLERARSGADNNPLHLSQLQLHSLELNVRGIPSANSSCGSPCHFHRIYTFIAMQFQSKMVNWHSVFMAIAIWNSNSAYRLSNRNIK